MLKRSIYGWNVTSVVCVYLRVVAPSLSMAQAVTGESVVAISVPPTLALEGADSMTGLMARVPLGLKR